MRPEARDRLFLDVAERLAQESTCLRGHVGAVIALHHRIVATGYNGAPPGLPHCMEVGCGGWVEGEDPLDISFPNGCTRATHAESNAVAFAARQGVPCDLATMYCTYATCASCAALVVAAGIVRFVYRKPYRLPQGLELLDKANVEVVQYGVE